jgi:hypothetical protein
VSVAARSVPLVTVTVNDDTARTHLLDLLDGITAGDDLEHEHLQRTRAWVTSGAELYRRDAIDVPPTHLVVYFLCAMGRSAISLA